MGRLFITLFIVVVGCLACGTAFGSESGSAGSPLSAANAAAAPEKGGSAGRHEPPPQAYTDCIGRKAGDTVQHATREGKVAATCVDSPKGLVARPNRTPGGQPADRPSRSTAP